MQDFAQRVHGIYDRYSPAIHPYIGTAFTEADPGKLRILAVGINAYSGEGAVGEQPPSLYGEWFASQRYRYQRGVWRDLQAIGKALTAAPSRTAHLEFAGMDSVYLTNAIKVYVPEATGKRAEQIDLVDFEKHLGQWRDEIELMAQAGVPPHVIAVVGRPFWRYACASFQKGGTFSNVRVSDYRWCEGSCLSSAFVTPRVAFRRDRRSGLWNSRNSKRWR
jgi:hypothetical protein